jgi:hypothetical protein
MLPGDFKKRFRLRLKNKVLKKRALRQKIKAHYNIYTNKDFNKLSKPLKKKKNRVMYLFYLLEFRLATVCLRFHFFWRLNKAFL